MSVSDADFYRSTVDEPILIEATIGELPGLLLGDHKFGLELRGWGPEGLHDEPEDDDEPVITVRLTIDDSLEPRWEVVNDRQSEPRPITARDREHLGVTRLGSDVEQHLTWGRRSALLRMTDSTEEMTRTLASVHRTAREMVNTSQLAALNRAAEVASENARALGAGHNTTYRAALDPGAGGIGTGALGLHDESVPVRASGLGSRRLAALAIQRASFPEGAIVLVDEIELGLEPHRLRHLIRSLRTVSSGQVLMTTHSEIPIVELSVEDLRVVSSREGTTSVNDVPLQLQADVRMAPEALLGRRLVIGEGKTEVGLCRSLDPLWTEVWGDPPAHRGVVLVQGQGTKAPGTALAFAGLGYATALLVDSDVPLDPSEEELTLGGVAVFAWDDEVSTEERVALDVPWPVLVTIIAQASALHDEDNPQAALDAIAAQLNAPAGTNSDVWLANGFSQGDIRKAVGRAAKKGKWFKRTDLGEVLGGLVVESLPLMESTDLALKLSSLANWAYA
ncbi:MAG TPA: AAA family ATPase [Actinomycetota bacterium]|nr:AAA family ATPase [Actinomycetota bacterium]